MYPSSQVWHYTNAAFAVRPLCEEALAIGRSLADPLLAADALHRLGHLCEDENDLDQALSLFDQSTALYREVGDQWGLTRPLLDLGRLLSRRGDQATARSLLEESRRIAREQGDSWFAALVLWTLGHVAVAVSDAAGAGSLFSEVLAQGQSTGERLLVLASLEGLARVSGLRGRWQEAARLLSAAESLRDAADIARNLPGQSGVRADTLTAVRAAVGDELFAAAWAEGRALPPDQAIAIALKQVEGQVSQGLCIVRYL